MGDQLMCRYDALLMGLTVVCPDELRNEPDRAAKRSMFYAEVAAFRKPLSRYRVRAWSADFARLPSVSAAECA